METLKRIRYALLPRNPWFASVLVILLAYTLIAWEEQRLFTIVGLLLVTIYAWANPDFDFKFNDKGTSKKSHNNRSIDKK